MPLIVKHRKNGEIIKKKSGAHLHQFIKHNREISTLFSKTRMIKARIFGEIRENQVTRNNRETSFLLIILAFSREKDHGVLNFVNQQLAMIMISLVAYFSTRTQTFASYLIL